MVVCKRRFAVQAKKVILTMSKLRQSVEYFEFVEYFKLFDSMIKPILTYGSEIGVYEISETIENVQIIFYKKYLKLPNCTLNALAVGECGRYVIDIDYFTRCIKHWLRLVEWI